MKHVFLNSLFGSKVMETAISVREGSSKVELRTRKLWSHGGTIRTRLNRNHLVFRSLFAILFLFTVAASAQEKVATRKNVSVKTRPNVEQESSGSSKETSKQDKPANSSPDDDRIAKSLDGITLFSPKQFGFDLEVKGAPEYPVKANVEIKDDSGQKTIGRCVVRYAEGSIVMLPDGNFVSRKANEIEATNKPFKPQSQRDIYEKLVKSEFPGMKAKYTSKYLFIYDTSEEFAEIASRILVSMLPGVRKHASAQGITVHDPEVPLVVIMFGRTADFRKYREVNEGILAFYEPISNRIVLHEESEMMRIDRDLAIRQSMSTIAHEGAHQILNNIGVQSRLSRWPIWLAEGLAEYYAPTELGSQWKWKGAGVVNDMRMFEVENLLSSQTSTEIDGSILRNVIRASQLDSADYAVSWSTIHYLADLEKKRLYELIRLHSQLRPMEGFSGARPTSQVASNSKNFEAIFGEDWKGLETKIWQHLQKQNYRSPFAEFIHHITYVEFFDGASTQRRAAMFLDQQSAELWRAKFLDSLPNDQRGTSKVRIERYQNRNLAVEARLKFINP
jgi:Protein of unknown function (DUF1570)